ncbi:MAG: glycosyltransferase [Nitrososphaerales archaeon]
MRVAIITPFYPPSIGGVETIAKDTAEELARRGHKVSVMTTTYDNT